MKKTIALITALFVVILVVVASCKKDNSTTTTTTTSTARSQADSFISGRQWHIFKMAYDSNANGQMDSNEIKLYVGDAYFDLYRIDHSGYFRLLNADGSHTDYEPMTWQLINGDQDLKVTDSNGTLISHIETLTFSLLTLRVSNNPARWMLYSKM